MSKAIRFRAGKATNKSNIDVSINTINITILFINIEVYIFHQNKNSNL
jgi:hypothetical protein